MKYLVKVIKRVESREQATSKKRASHENSSGILTYGALKQAMVKWRCKPTTTRDSALDHISGSHFIWVKNGIQILILVFTKLINGLHIAIGETNWNLCDYPLLQNSKGIIVMCMIIFYPLLVCG